MSKATQEKLEALHGQLAETLAAKIESGDATAAEMAVARQFLKDNSIQSIPKKGTPLGNLADSLPFPDPDDIARDGELLN